jgi:DNA-binding CsgD family transcriptional regulator
MPQHIEATDLAEVVASLGDDSFWDVLLDVLRRYVPFGSFAVFTYRDGRFEDALSLDVSAADQDALEKHYYKGAYVLGPWYPYILAGKSGFWTLDEVAPAGFKSSTYFKRYFGPSNIRDEGDWIVDCGDGLITKASMTRYKQEGRFLKKEFRFAEENSPLIASLIQKHMRLKSPSPSVSETDYRLRLLEYGADVLTAREREVLQLMIRGHSIKSCARELDISTETIRVHRSNVYRKLKVPNQSLLLAEVVEFLIAAGERHPSNGG